MCFRGIRILALYSGRSSDKTRKTGILHFSAVLKTLNLNAEKARKINVL
jgi:hypothetical protein